jgi:putative transposase
VEERLRSLLIEKATANGWDIPELEIMPDHVHLFVKATPSDSIAHITSQLKGYTSFSLRNEFPHLKQRVPTLWTRSYYVETIGHISEKTILKYIEDQKKK